MTEEATPPTFAEIADQARYQTERGRIDLDRIKDDIDVAVTISTDESFAGMLREAQNHLSQAQLRLISVQEQAELRAAEAAA